VQEDGRLFLHRIDRQAQAASLGQELRGREGAGDVVAPGGKGGLLFVSAVKEGQSARLRHNALDVLGEAARQTGDGGAQFRAGEHEPG
jgi:hypothetical protein